MSSRREIESAINNMAPEEQIGLRRGVFSCPGAGNTYPYDDKWERVGDAISVDIGNLEKDPRIYEVESCKYFDGGMFGLVGRGRCQHPRREKDHCDKNNVSRLNGEKITPREADKFIVYISNIKTAR